MRLRLLVTGTLVALCAIAQSLRYFRASLDAGLINSVARVTGHSMGMKALNAPGFLDWISTTVWRVGGFSALEWARWLGYFCVWAVGLSVVATLVLFADSLIRSAATRRLILGVCVAVWLWLTLSGAWTAISWRREALRDPALVAPISLLDTLKKDVSGRVYCNFQALPDLLVYCPKLVDKDLSPVRIGALGLAPSAWRQEDRRQRFGAVLLVEPAAESEPLLRHLLISPDWHLAALNNLGMLFLPGDGPLFQPPSPENALPPLADNRSKAIYLAQMAQQLYTAGFTAASNDYIAAAQQIDGEDPNVLMRAATLLALDKKWNDALDVAKEAVRKQPDLVQAKMILARAFLAVGSPAQAFRLAHDVVLDAPENVFALFLMARAADANHDYVAEAAALEKIISICQSAGQQVGQYRILLAQAYARQGLGSPALDQYRQALQSGEIGATQSRTVQEAMKTIQTKMPRETR